jgi:acetoacetyl-CoA synthetase
MRNAPATPIWSPSDSMVRGSWMTGWMASIQRDRGIRLETYDDAWHWSVQDLPGFWSSIADFFSVRWDAPPGEVVSADPMHQVSWFRDSQLNFARELISRLGSGTVIHSRSQTRAGFDLTAAELADHVARARMGLVSLGISRGDRVAAYLPNIPETLILMLAAASIGAPFTSCPPEFGARAVADRLRQVEPALLVATNGYSHKGRAIDRRGVVGELMESIPSLRHVVMVPYLEDSGAVPAGAITWSELLSQAGELSFEPVPFDHPLYILYSSGTTGLPKAIIHGHGGILLEHLKLHHLHHDLKPTDCFFWHTTTGWVMWNYLISGLLTGSSVLLFDGDPMFPSPETLWRLAEEVGVTVFGASPGYYTACERQRLVPAERFTLSGIREICSTGAPLSPASYRWIYESVSPEVYVVSASGGTDVCTAFVAGSPILPVYAGEIACRCLGAKVEAFDPAGRPVIEEEGELVVTAPMPSMPVGLYGDTDRSRLKDTYYSHFPGVWRQGDLITIHQSGTCTISGRSDATLNRGGVRLGAAELYGVLDSFPGISDSLAIHLSESPADPGALLLFVQPEDDREPFGGLESQISSVIRERLSPRHVPDCIVRVPAVPRTLSGKRLEVPIKRILQGSPASDVAARDALADPESLDFFETFDWKQAVSSKLGFKSR